MEWWGVVVFRLRWPVLAAWGLALIVAVPLLPGLPARLSAGGFDDPTLPSSQATATLSRELGLPANAAAIFYRIPARHYAEPEIRAAVAASLERVRGMPEVLGIVPPDLNSRQIGRSGGAAYALVSLSGTA